MRQMCLLGTSPIYLPWRRDVRHEFRSRRDGKKVLPKKQEIELFNGPDFVVRDLFRWYAFNPKKSNLEDGCFEIMACSKFELEAMERKGLLANLDKILGGASDAYLEEEFNRDILRARRSQGASMNQVQRGVLALRGCGDPQGQRHRG